MRTEERMEEMRKRSSTYRSILHDAVELALCKGYRIQQMTTLEPSKLLCCPLGALALSQNWLATDDLDISSDALAKHLILPDGGFNLVQFVKSFIYGFDETIQRPWEENQSIRAGFNMGRDFLEMLDAHIKADEGVEPLKAPFPY